VDKKIIYRKLSILNKIKNKDPYHPVVVPPAEADLIPHPLMNHLWKKVDQKSRASLSLKRVSPRGWSRALWKVWPRSSHLKRLIIYFFGFLIILLLASKSSGIWIPHPKGLFQLHAKQSKLQYRRENLKKKKCRQHLKIFLPSTILILTKAYPTIAL
jgi:hypothetical protein